MDDLSGWLRLAHTPAIGQRARNYLLAHYQHPEHCLTANSSELRKIGLTQAQIGALKRKPSHEMESLITRTLEWLEHSQNHIIHRKHPLYPNRLNEIADPPTLLYVTGDPEVLLTSSIGIVGSRKCTPAGLATARRLASDLCRLGLTVGSGMALGVDQAAHQAALDSDGLTFAVAGTGLDRVYPARHHELARAISQTGALVSELPLGAGPKACHFPRRNRIISGLSTGVVIIEAALRSGTLITARHARDQGREVMAVPGSINNPLSQGCNALIREGAILVQSAEDIVTEIAAQIDIDPLITAGSPSSGSSDSQATTDTTEKISCNLLNLMGFDPISIDSLVAQSGQDTQKVAIRLSQLELEGRVNSLSGGRYVRC